MKPPLSSTPIERPPRGLAILMIIGPSLVWCAEFIGSGEVILATRTGAILGTSVLWAVVIGIFLKYWIGMSGARYTACTGEGMIDLFSRMPGPRNWAVWLVAVAQCIAAAVAIASVANAAGIFLTSLIPIPHYWAGWMVTLFALLVVWSGEFKVLKIVETALISIVILGVMYVALHVFPSLADFIKGLIPQKSAVPAWALEKGVNANPWREILPLLGWGAGGFASQVWYSYWVMGAGYGATAGSSYGQPADTARLRTMGRTDGEYLRGWCRIIYVDATIAMVIGVVVTSCFLISGAGILGARHLAPDGPGVALTLSNLFSSRWGKIGGCLFLVGGAAAMISTQIGQLAGWPRLLSDALRICIPSFNRRLTPRHQFRCFLIFYLFTSMIIIYTFGLQPVLLVKTGAILDGLLLTPLQALWVGVGLYFIMPKLFNPDTAKQLRPHWIFGVILAIAFLVFGYFCVFQIPQIF